MHIPFRRCKRHRQNLTDINNEKGNNMCDNDAVHIDIEEFAAHMAETRKDTGFTEDSDTETEALCNAMCLNLKSEMFYDAFECARALRNINFSKYRDSIINCYKICADNDLAEAMLEMLKLLINNRTQTTDPEAFPYLQRLSVLGYIESFRWLGDCYYFGIGCDKDAAKASHSYFEALLFDSNMHSKRQLQKIYKNRQWNDDLMSRLMKSLIFNDEYPGCSGDAAEKIAEMILDGQLSGYEPETAYFLLKRVTGEDGIGHYRLGECLLNGLGTEPNPVAAQDVLWNAQWELEWTIDELEEDDRRYEIENGFHGNYDFRQVLEKVNEMMEEAEIKIRELAEKQGCIDEMQILDDWENEKIIRIKRRSNSSYT